MKSGLIFIGAFRNSSPESLSQKQAQWNTIAKLYFYQAAIPDRTPRTFYLNVVITQNQKYLQQTFV